MIRENLVQTVARIIDGIPQCDGATYTADLDEGAREIVDTLRPESKPGRGEELIEDLYEVTRNLPPYEDKASQRECDDALTALILYVVAIEAKPTVYRSSDTVEVGPLNLIVPSDGSDEEYDKRIRELSAFCKDSPTNTAYRPTGAEHLRPSQFKVRAKHVSAKLKSLPLRISDIVAKVDKAKVNNGETSVYVDLIGGERVRLIGIGRTWLRVMLATGEVRENVSPGEVVEVIT